MQRYDFFQNRIKKFIKLYFFDDILLAMLFCPILPAKKTKKIQMENILRKMG